MVCVILFYRKIDLSTITWIPMNKLWLTKYFWTDENIVDFKF